MSVIFVLNLYDRYRSTFTFCTWRRSGSRTNSKNVQLDPTVNSSSSFQLNVINWCYFSDSRSDRTFLSASKSTIWSVTAGILVSVLQYCSSPSSLDRETTNRQRLPSARSISLLSFSRTIILRNFMPHTHCCSIVQLKLIRPQGVFLRYYYKKCWKLGIS